MDFQNLINAINDQDSENRSHYHLTYGNLIDVLKNAPNDSLFDDRIKGISSYRGYYIDIALNTDETGWATSDEDYDWDNYNQDDYTKWANKHIHQGVLPKNPKEFAQLLESIIGQGFDGYKGGWYQITREKPLWLASDYGDTSQIAVIGIDENLKLITKEIEL